jgi:hypothetical protein
MRTFVRVIAFLVVFGVGAIFAVIGCAYLISYETSSQVGREAQSPPVSNGRAPYNTATPPEPSAVAPVQITVQPNQTVALFGGDVFLTLVGYYSGGWEVGATVGSPGYASQTVQQMRPGDTIRYKGKRCVEIRLLSIIDTPGAIGARPASFAVREEESQAMLGWPEAEGAGPPIPAATPAVLGLGAVLTAVGLALMVSGTVLIAVRPRQRQIPARLPLSAPSGASPAVSQALSELMTHTGPQQVKDAKPVEPSRPQAPEARQQTPLVPAATPPPAVRQSHPARIALLVIGIALVGVGLLVAIVGVSAHNPHSSSFGHGYSSSGGDATAIIGAGVLILITGAGLVVVSLFLRRGAAPKR